MPVKVVMADDEHGVILLLCSILSKLEGALVVGTAENAKDTIKLTMPFCHSEKIEVIDLGCGTGTISRAVKNVYPQAKITCIGI